MKKVLVIARYFGSRIPGLLKNLPDFGWQPVLLTTSLPPEYEVIPGISVIETQSRTESYLTPASGRSILDRILSRGGEIINYPDSYKGWKKPAVQAADDFIQTTEIDAVISSSAPLTAHLIARELKRIHGLPWIADLRDLWSQNHNYYYSSLRKWFDRRLELKTLADADALVTVSRPWADRLSTLHRGKAVSAITNGFDEVGVNAVSTDVKPGFTLTYTGNIYRGKQNPGRLLVALRYLIDEGTIDRDDIEVRFYVPRLDWLDREIVKHSLSGVVKQYDLVSPQAVIEKQKESQVLLILDWDDGVENGWYPLKVFEYLGAARPILAVGGIKNNAVDLLLDKTKAGIHAVTDEAVRDSLAVLYREYKQKGRVDYHGVDEEIKKYNHVRMTGEFVEILRRFVK